MSYLDIIKGNFIKINNSLNRPVENVVISHHLLKAVFLTNVSAVIACYSCIRHHGRIQKVLATLFGSIFSDAGIFNNTFLYVLKNPEDFLLWTRHNSTIFLYQHYLTKSLFFILF